MPQLCGRGWQNLQFEIAKLGFRLHELSVQIIEGYGFGCSC
jgi:hypothetical protein